MAKVTTLGWNTRNFNGKSYKLRDRYTTKAEAQSRAVQLRKQHKYVRVAYIKPYWCIYTRA